MALTKVEVQAINDGTDGQLITWDADGNPVTVGPGTSGQVITSAGAGAPPTFSEIVDNAAAMALALGG
jgi:hypothetical protein|tara:strand:- start:782 stop:985 length:204 start_codon:yes stop_codon:yes gene_type:complete